MINVLYVHHCGIYGGASRSLFEAISNFPQGKVKPYLITQKGNVSKIAKEMENTKGLIIDDNLS